MKKIELTTMTVADLKALAKEKKMALPAGAKKDEIMALLAKVAKAGKTAPKKTVAKKTATKKTAIKKTATKKTAAPQKTAAKKTVIAKKPAAKKSVLSRKGSVDKKRAAPVRVIANKRTKLATPVREWKRPPKAEEPFMTQEMVSESKFYTGPVGHPLVASYGDLPQGYGEEKISLLSRDPHVAYAYWEMTPERLEREKGWFGVDSKLCVRIYDVTGVQFDGRNALGYYDQEVFERIGSWYFDIGRPTHAFCADLGLLSSEGRFLTIARSDCITMPRDSVSDVVDEEWMLLDEEFMRLYGIPSGLSSPEMQEMVKLRRKLEITSPGMFSRPPAKRK